jgi:hypothetical protein
MENNFSSPSTDINYSAENEKEIEYLKDDITKMLIDYEKIIKISLYIFLLVSYYLYVFRPSEEVFSNSTKFYIYVLLIIIIYFINSTELITLLKLLVFLIFISVIIGFIYYNIDRLEFIILFYYSFNYQLEKIYNNTSANYNEVIFSFIFISIISILSIVLYWDNIYTDSKKLSKCGKLINIIEENNKKKKPFVYNIIVMNNDLINTSTSHYVLKITYDFIKNKTIVDFGTDKGNYEDGSESFKKPDYLTLLKSYSGKLNNLKETKKNIDNEIIKLKSIKSKTSIQEDNLAKLITDLNTITSELTTTKIEYDKLMILIKKDEEKADKAYFFYFNLKTMKSEKIETIDANIINSETYKYILVDEYNNKVPYEESSKELIKFTKNYSNNEFYNINIINDIIYAKNNRNKLFI